MISRGAAFIADVLHEGGRSTEEGEMLVPKISGAQSI